MARPKAEAAPAPIEAPQSIPAAALVQLNQSYSDAVLAAEKHSHAQTKVALIEAAARARMAEAHAEVSNFFATKQAAEKRHRDLTQDIKQTHNLTEKHAIDPLTGVVLLPES